MLTRTDADWQALCAELGRLCGEVVTLRRAVAERDAELRDARLLIAAMRADRAPQAPPEGAN